MSRQERENMIQFLSKVQGMKEGKLMLMTDEDVEHLYTRAYLLYEKA
ncbi:BH0509 family protein [Alkalihalobacillus sp. MEB130]|nr:BH0509 family protein [Alkalihalobacillus sp. MEB130]MDT8862697.1 BH0509 family protein [Alkalihalobacillus sp. MEB130]